MSGAPRGYWRVTSIALDPSGQIAATVISPSGVSWSYVMDYPGKWVIRAEDGRLPDRSERRAIKRVVFLLVIELAANRQAHHPF